MGSFKRPLAFSCVFAMFVVLPFAARPADEDSTTLRAEIEKASSLHSVRKVGLPPFVLQGSLKFWRREKSPLEGRYRLIATPQGKWKEEIVLPGFSRLRIGEGDHFAQKDSANVVIPLLYTLDVLLDLKKALYLDEADSLKKAKTPKSAPSSDLCIKRKKKGSEDLFCFDASTGELHSRSTSTEGPGNEWAADLLEFSDFERWSGRSYPKKLRASFQKKPLVEVTLQEIRPAENLPEGFFAIPDGSEFWGDCDNPAPWKLDARVQPSYPESARANHHQGIVTLYAVIEPDGHIGDLRVAISAGQDLDQASLSAVKQWRYVPVGCSGSPGRTISLIDVTYTLQR